MHDQLQPGDLVKSTYGPNPILWPDIEENDVHTGWRMKDNAIILETLAMVVAVTDHVGGREKDKNSPRAVVVIYEDRLYWTWDYQLRKL